MEANKTEILKNKIQELLSVMGFDVEVFERQEEGRVVFNIKTRDAQLLIGKQGNNLVALQYIIRLLVRKEIMEEEFSFAIDIDDYKDKRVVYLKELARKAAHQARETKRAIALSPMLSYERRVIHNYLSLFSDLSSESIGEEPNRRVVIKHKTQKKTNDDFAFIENS